MKKILSILLCSLFTFLLFGCSSTSLNYEEFENNLLDNGYSISAGSKGAFITKKYPNGDVRIISYNNDEENELECVDSYLFSGVYFDLITSTIKSTPKYIEDTNNINIDEYSKYVVDELSSENISCENLSMYLKHIVGSENDKKETTSNNLLNYKNKTFEDEYVKANYSVPDTMTSIISYLDNSSKNASIPWNFYLSNIKKADDFSMFSYTIKFNDVIVGDINFMCENSSLAGIVFESENDSIDTSSSGDDYAVCLMLVQAFNQESSLSKDDLANIMTQIELSKTTGAGAFGNSYFAIEGDTFTIMPK